MARFSGSVDMEAWDIIVLGQGPAALRAAAEAAKGGASTLLMSADGLGTGDRTAADGLAAPLQETNNRGHREDTIRAGAFLCDQDIVNARTSSAVRQMDLLERWGVIFRRDSSGIPYPRKSAGHSKPRVVDSGDSFSREVQTVLEEQCMKHGVTRRGDQLPLQLVSSNGAVHGLIAVDMVNGRVMSLQAKAVIIADGGFEGVFSHGVNGLGMDLALRAGIALRDMEFISNAPLAIKDTNMVLPMGLLSDGAKLHEATGSELDIGEGSMAEINSAVQAADMPVLDARGLDESAPWWAATFRMVKQRTGIDLSRQTVAIESRPDQTIGGIPVDEHGRVVIGAWSRWFTGLYAAGDAACSGLNGAGVVAGNRLLDAVAGGVAAGSHASEWASGAAFSGSSLITEAAGAQTDALTGEQEVPEAGVIRAGNASGMLRNAATAALLGSRDASSLQSGIEELSKASELAASLYVDQSSLIASTNLLENARIQAGARLSLVAAQSALAREESRGLHMRSDFPEASEDLIHHITVDGEGQVSTLAVRKGESGNWVLAPQ